MEKFLQYDQGRTDPVSAINVEIDFLLSVPQVGQHQSYKISIDIISYVQLVDDKRANYGLRVYGPGKHPIEYTINYIDYVVARSFKQTIDEWVDSLPEVDIFKIADWIDNGVYPLSKIISLISSISSVLLFLNYFAPKIDLSIKSVAFTVASILILSEVFSYVLDQTFDLIGARSFFPFILINKGDSRNFGKFISRRKRARQLGSFLLVVCLLPIVLNLIAAYLDRSVIQ